MGKMDGLVAIVTGASRGLGRAIAKDYGREGASVVACARLASPTKLPGTVDDTASSIVAAGGVALAVPCDVADEEQVKNVVEQTMACYGRIDVLVNNAGLMLIGESFVDVDTARWDEQMLTNVRGPYLMCKYILPIMMKQRRGSIINIGSRMGFDVGRGGGVPYATSKAALHMLSNSLAVETKEHNIAINVLTPGALKSEGSSVIPWAQHDWHERVDPEDVTPGAVWLALQDAESFTGQLVMHRDFGKTWGVEG